MTGQASGQRKPSQRYREYSDLNDYLCGRKQEQKNGQKLLLRQKKGRGI